jgi:hypothetical protein
VPLKGLADIQKQLREPEGLACILFKFRADNTPDIIGHEVRIFSEAFLQNWQQAMHLCSTQQGGPVELALCQLLYATEMFVREWRGGTGEKEFPHNSGVICGQQTGILCRMSDICVAGRNRVHKAP